MNKRIIISTLVLAAIQSTGISAHAEHDKPRFVATDGIDKGRCEVASSPCKTIRYAAQNANKGDNIRIASGNYQISDSSTLFYLLSQTLPIKGNYSREDNFHHSNEKNVTRLSGVPLEYAQQLRDKGFAVIVDRKEINDQQTKELRKNLDIYSRMKTARADEACINGVAGDFACNNIDLLAHIPLSDFSTNPAEANDIWGHYDLNNGNEYALIGLRNGIGIVNITDPVNPEIVTTIPSQSTIWRDLKVYQVFNSAENIWKSYAYVTADNASVGLLIIDLNDLPNSAEVVTTMTTDLSAHNVYLSNVDYSTGVRLANTSPYLHIAGSNRNGGAFNSYGLQNPVSLTTIYRPDDATGSDYSHDVSSMVITDSRKDNQCVNGTDHCEIFFDFNENSFRIWDKTNNSVPVELSDTTYSNANYVHSGWYTEDKLVVVVHDELDEQNANLNTTVRFFGLDNLNQPNLISTWTGPTRAIDHNGFVRGNRYYMSNYERGLTVLDISDPNSPSEIGFFDTYPFANSASFNGAWGVYPFLPSGNLLVSDINSGLYILRDKTLSSTQGSLRFSQNNFNVIEGENASVTIERISGSQGDVQIAWELSPGSADEEDFVVSSGTLQWNDGDTTARTIEVQVNSDITGERAEMFFVRLIDPKNGATLGNPNLATVTIAQSLGNNTPEVYAGSDKNATINQSVTLDATASDADGDDLVFDWTQISGPSVTLSDSTILQPSFTPTEIGEFEFNLNVTDSTGKSANDSVIITSLASNQDPEANAGSDQQGVEGDTFNLTGTASDPDNDSLTFTWTQTAGTEVTLSSTSTLETSFTAPAADTYTFNLEVSDGRGGIANSSVSVTAEAKPTVTPPPPPQKSSGGGSLGIFSFVFLLLGNVLLNRRKNNSTTMD